MSDLSDRLEQRLRDKLIARIRAGLPDNILRVSPQEYRSLQEMYARGRKLFDPGFSQKAENIELRSFLGRKIEIITPVGLEDAYGDPHQPKHSVIENE